MKRLIAITACALAAGVALVVTSSASTVTPDPLKAQLRAQKSKIARLTRREAADAALIAVLRGKLATDGESIGTLNQKVGARDDAIDGLNQKLATSTTTVTALTAQVTTLTAQVSQQAQGGLAAVVAGSPDDLWNAVVAIYAKFPTLPNDQICGYDKSTDTSPGAPPTATDYTFTQWAGGCSG